MRAVRAALLGRTIAEAAHELGVSGKTLGRWVEKYPGLSEPGKHGGKRPGAGRKKKQSAHE